MPTFNPTPALTSTPTPTAIVDSSLVLSAQSITYPRIQTLPSPTPLPPSDAKLVTQNIVILNRYLPILSWLRYPNFSTMNLFNISSSGTYIGITTYTSTTLLPITSQFIINK